MVSGEDSTVRPLRAATPPEDVPPAPRRGWIPRPRRPHRAPSSTPAPTAPVSPTADAAAQPRTPEVRPQPTTPESQPTTPGSEPTPTTGTDGTPEPAVKTDAEPAAKTGPGDEGGSAAKGDGDDEATPGTQPPAGGGAVAGRRRRIPFAHAVRLPPPRQAVGAATRATRAWSRRPSGRLTLPALFLFALVAATAAVGAVVVPGAVRAPRPVAVDDPATTGSGLPSVATTTGIPVLPGGGVPSLPPAGFPPGGVAPTGPVAPTAAGRPADALGDWARVTGTKVAVSPIAMQAYGYAELVLARTNPSCRLSWTTLAAIGYVESRHGQANGATLGPDGRAVPEIIGDPLDGKGGRSLIRDTDGGLFDRDTVYDRAIGPMQFIPTTWEQVGADADNDGRKDPHDLDDTALAAGNYLCQGGRNMTIPGDWWGAILSYNDVRRYAQDVFDKAHEYGRASRT
ncbi:lytic murein transglycosylase [Micromonospora sp. RL09-050-HVF-A]|uniref:lytic murein transglycosylase n=1 Tax=Micromonospora sp. RL09-050-HVF-A TaxID=1703433 RepID=UPI001C5E9F13|nr:lytic murein transglycosylase [Micromonospora sp. RL09-050-HVF-A]MBW4703405.1 lytic murein transglycosylase [Micromonospora sp. RL09-050-HVF-A]